MDNNNVPSHYILSLLGGQHGKGGKQPRFDDFTDNKPSGRPPHNDYLILSFIFVENARYLMEIKAKIPYEPAVCVYLTFFRRRREST